MSLTNSLINEIENESVSMVKSLERIPTDKWDWRPHPKSTNLKALATHIAQLASMPAAIVGMDELDLAKAEPAPEIKSAQDLVALYKKGKEQSVEALKNTSDEELDKEWTLRYGDHVIKTLPKKDMIRNMGLSHSYHHRAQLGVYLRLLDQPVPSVYGPSADEQA